MVDPQGRASSSIKLKNKLPDESYSRPSDSKNDENVRHVPDMPNSSSVANSLRSCRGAKKEMMSKLREDDIVDLTMDSPSDDVKTTNSTRSENQKFPHSLRARHRTRSLTRQPRQSHDILRRVLDDENSPNGLDFFRDESVHGSCADNFVENGDRNRVPRIPVTGSTSGTKHTREDDTLGSGTLLEGQPPFNRDSSGASSSRVIANGKLPEGILPTKRKCTSLGDTARRRQRFRPPRLLNDSSVSSSTSAAPQRPIQIDVLEPPEATNQPIPTEVLNSPRTRGTNLSARSNQIEEDEMLARILQEEYSMEARPSVDDAQFARMLQEEENARLRNVTHPSFDNTSTIATTATTSTTLDDARRELQRILPSLRSHSSRPVASSSRMRILRNLHSRAHQNWTRGQHVGGRLANTRENLYHFPEGVDLDTRLDFLAAMESVSQEGFPLLARIDRDFNENDYEMLLALDENNHSHRGASRHRIEQLPVSVIKSTDVCTESCSICLEVPVVGDTVRRLPCMHSFHQQCIDSWLERQANCPICKVSL